ncbi:hypothetical protein C8J57DRAFT_1533868 [Mycena rebaudengoi]|nr:hypothetical protein C8J57DRAFT_1533868 [Mycena rebaudengoi]
MKLNGQKSKLKQKIQILDLEHAEEGDNNFDNGLGIMEKEKQFLTKLQAEFGHCQLCGPTKACKINVSGSHQKLSNQQLSSWALASATGTHNVILKMPLNNDLFGTFFKKSRSVHEAATTNAPQPTYPQYMPQPYDTTDANDGQSPAYQASGSKLTTSFPSSNPPELDTMNPYPEITDFIQKLQDYQPKQQLL